MTGLLIKDFRLLKVQKNFFTLIVFILLGMILFSEDNFFAVSFATFIFSLFSTSTVSYDEFDNGNPFLFSLPVTRKGYVLEKYCFGLILGGSAWFVSTLLVVIVQLTKGAASLTDLLLPSLALLPFMLFLLAVMLPIQLKFGSEKGRIVLFLLIGGVILSATLLLKLPVFYSNVLTILNMVLALPIFPLLVVFFLLIATSLSYIYSCHIMQNREF